MFGKKKNIKIETDENEKDNIEIKEKKKRKKNVEKKPSKKEKEKSKTDVIRVRISPTKKNILKRIAEEKNIAMSDIINQAIERELERFEYRVQFQDKLEKRIVTTDERLFKLKEKLYK